MISSGTRTVRTPSGTSASTPSDRITVSSPGHQRTASASSLVPSATKSPVCCRSFLEETSRRTCWIRGFFLAVIRCSIRQNAFPPPLRWQYFSVYPLLYRFCFRLQGGILYLYCVGQTLQKKPVFVFPICENFMQIPDFTFQIPHAMIVKSF